MQGVWVVNYRYDDESEIHIYAQKDKAVKRAFDIISEEVFGILDEIKDEPRFKQLLIAVDNNWHEAAIRHWGIEGDNMVTVEYAKLED